MITNDLQYRITKAQRNKFAQAVDAFNLEAASRRSGSEILAKAELDALRSEVDSLSDQLREYETLKSGAVTVLEANSLEELPLVLIRARIANGLSQKELAEKLGMKEQQVQRYEAERYASASLSRLTEVAEVLGLSVREVAEMSAPLRSETKGDYADLDWGLFPVKEMYLRGWFEDFKGSLSAAESCARELVSAFVEAAMPRRQPALLRQKARVGSNADTYALLAWQCRVLMLSQGCRDLGNFDRRALNEEWFTELAQLSRLADGPVKAREYLSSSGIRLVFEPHLQKTYLDGAVFLLPDKRPVIGMTLRYDRTDYFWFVLFHELAHIVLHLRKGKMEDIFDDLDGDGDRVEQETDSFAGNMLIPDTTWETALARYLRTEDSVRDLAKELSISPAIVAGRIRKEADNYTILSELVGHGAVRKQFAEVRFG